MKLFSFIFAKFFYILILNNTEIFYSKLSSNIDGIIDTEFINLNEIDLGRWLEAEYFVKYIKNYTKDNKYNLNNNNHK